MSKPTAVGMYAVWDRDPMDFLELLPEMEVDQLNLLYQMLTVDNPKHSDVIKKLNKIGSDVVGKHIKGRGLPLPEVPEET